MKRFLIPLLTALALPTAVNAELITNIDDFENSTTWALRISSKNKMPFYSEINTSPFIDSDFKTSAKITLFCKKYADNYRYMEDALIYDPSAPIVKNGKAELKFDNLPPQVQNLNDRGILADYGQFSFDHTKDLIKRLYEHSTLNIRYRTIKGIQIAEFVLDKDNEIAKFWKKCYVDK